MDGWWFVASAGDAERAAVRAASPLAVDLFLVCGPVRVPIEVSAAEATLERQASEPAQILRSFLENNPWEGMGSVTPHRWMLLARNDETIVFGQRDRPLGLGPVVTMSRRDIHGELRERFRARNMGGGRPVLHDGSGEPGQDIEWPEPSFRAVVETGSPHTVRVSWDCSQDLAGVVHRIHARTEVLETPESVHFLLVSGPNPEFRPAPPGYAEVGTGCGVETSIELASPLGERALFSDYGAPATRVLVDHAETP